MKGSLVLVATEQLTLDIVPAGQVLGVHLLGPASLDQGCASLGECSQLLVCLLGQVVVEQTLVVAKAWQGAEAALGSLDLASLDEASDALGLDSVECCCVTNILGLGWCLALEQHLVLES